MKRRSRIIVGLLVVLFLFLGLNYQQLYSAWAIKRETKRLVALAENRPDEFQNPAPMEDHFDGGKRSSEFWRFSNINGGGKVSNENDWHAVSLSYKNGLTIQHRSDPNFANENSDPTWKPAAGQYNNSTLIGGSGFQPTPSQDVVLQFALKVSQPFYGTAGVIFQQMGTLQPDGMFAKPFDMFGFLITGEESSLQGTNGASCYLALFWALVKVDDFPADIYDWHDYEIRLKWLSKTEWLGTMNMDGVPVCEMSMPSFGPVEVHAWSDNLLLDDKPRHWWEIGPSVDLKFQDSGYKQFLLRSIKIFADAHEVSSLSSR